MFRRFDKGEMGNVGGGLTIGNNTIIFESEDDLRAYIDFLDECFYPDEFGVNVAKPNISRSVTVGNAIDNYESRLINGTINFPIKDKNFYSEHVDDFANCCDYYGIKYKDLRTNKKKF